MRPVAIALIFSAGLLTGAWRQPRPQIEIIDSFNARPIGPCEPYAETCRHCTDCTQCRHCSQKGGKCSVCWKK
jgi:hypothetical protein